MLLPNSSPAPPGLSGLCQSCSFIALSVLAAGSPPTPCIITLLAYSTALVMPGPSSPTWSTSPQQGLSTLAAGASWNDSSSQCLFYSPDVHGEGKWKHWKRKINVKLNMVSVMVQVLWHCFEGNRCHQGGQGRFSKVSEADLLYGVWMAGPVCSGSINV